MQTLVFSAILCLLFRPRPPRHHLHDSRPACVKWQLFAWPSNLRRDGVGKTPAVRFNCDGGVRSAAVSCFRLWWAKFPRAMFHTFYGSLGWWKAPDCVSWWCIANHHILWARHKARQARIKWNTWLRENVKPSWFVKQISLRNKNSLRQNSDQLNRLEDG